MSGAPRKLVALDVDGTVLQESGVISDAVIAEVQRVAAAGHEVLLATGRSASTTLPVLERLGIVPEYVVCANGAVVLRRDDEAPVGYVRAHVETFDPGEVLRTIRDELGDASYAVEDADGAYRYAGAFPDGALGAASISTPFEQLLEVEATRVVVISPEHELEDFLAVVERMGLHKVSYNIGWTAWLDIAPDGVNKGTALDLVQDELGIHDADVIVMGDGRNDIDMFRWAASGGGVAVAMGQAPPEVIEAATEVTLPDTEDGVAMALRRLLPA
jgi:5-amino-6-(5-phospho-D-ribitylamino)uracil phosphatase